MQHTPRRSRVEARSGTFWSGLLNTDQGSTLVELTILLPVLFTIVLSGLELGMYIQRSILIIEAASVGSRFGIIAGNATNTAGMIQAATSEAEGIGGFNVSAVSFCSCSPGGARITCSTSCGSGYQASHYVQVTTSASVPGIFNVTGLPKSMRPSATSTMRASWPGQ